MWKFGWFWVNLENLIFISNLYSHLIHIDFAFQAGATYTFLLCPISTRVKAIFYRYAVNCNLHFFVQIAHHLTRHPQWLWESMNEKWQAIVHAVFDCGWVFKPPSKPLFLQTWALSSNHIFLTYLLPAYIMQYYGLSRTQNRIKIP